MKWNFRTKLTLLVFALILTALGGATAFFFSLYKNDKLAGVLQAELSNTTQAASHLENLLVLAELIAPDKVASSREILFLYEEPCGARPRGGGSSHYEKQFRDLELSPAMWLQSKEVVKICTEFRKEVAALNVASTASATAALIQDAGGNNGSQAKTAGTQPIQAQPGSGHAVLANQPPSSPAGGTLTPASPEPSLLIVPSKTQLMSPYVLIFIRKGLENRMAMLAMDGFNTSAANTIFLINSKGEILWAADGREYVENSMKDTGVSAEYLKKVSDEAVRSGIPKVERAGSEGLLSFARVGQDWTLVSLSYAPTAMQPVYYALRQSIFLVMGFCLLCLFIGKNGAAVITRPLNELRGYAEKLGQGDFHMRFDVKEKSSDEISVVKLAFNVMTDKIIKLLDDTKAKATLESELQLAQQVQMMLMPSPAVQLSQHRMFSFVQSASQCGGDWWGYMEVPRAGSTPLLVVMVGDVVGHGAPSALIAATVRGALSVLTSWIQSNPELATDPRRIIEHFNRCVFEAAKGSITMTFFASVMDLNAQELKCANAGHNLPYLLIPEAPGKFRITVVGRSGVPLGYGADTKYEEIDSYPWTKGSQLFLYSDGLIECMQGEKNLFDRKSLQRALKAYGGFKGKDLLSRTLMEREKKINNLPPGDDVTAIVCEAKG